MKARHDDGVRVRIGGLQRNLDAVAETRLRPRHRVAIIPVDTKDLIVGELPERHDGADAGPLGPEKLDLALDERSTGIALDRSRPVVGRGATNGGGDVRIGELETIPAVERFGLVGKPGAMQSAVQPVSRFRRIR